MGIFTIGVTNALLTNIKIIDPSRIGEMMGIFTIGVTNALLTNIKIIDPSRIGDESGTFTRSSVLSSPKSR
jgi:hypothetical protein